MALPNPELEGLNDVSLRKAKSEVFSPTCMYFPINSARKLASDLGIPIHGPPAVRALCPSPGGYLFASLTSSSLSIWRLRPSVILAQLNRSPISIQDHGENITIQWSPDSSGIVIQTQSHLLLIDVKHAKNPEPYQLNSFNPDLGAKFLAGPGEGMPLERIHLSFQGVIPVDGTITSISVREGFIMYSTSNPNTIQRISWPSGPADQAKEDRKTPYIGHDTWPITPTDFPWLPDHDVFVRHVRATDDAEVWVMSDGGTYFVRLEHPAKMDEKQLPLADVLSWQGLPLSTSDYQGSGDLPCFSAINSMFSLIAIGTKSGEVYIFEYPNATAGMRKLGILKPPNPATSGKQGEVSTMQWSPDGYVLAVGFANGWAIWGVGGRCLVWGFLDDPYGLSSRFEDVYMQGISDLFWAMEGVELIVVPRTPTAESICGEIFMIPFAKNALASQPAPNNTSYALLQLEDRVMIYRGADQPDMSIINPESDVWQHIKIPLNYIAKNWPIKYASVSNDGRLLAVAGRRGLLHYSSATGRWKTFENETQEQAFCVKGGLVWFNHILIAAIEVPGSHQIRLYSRDLNLTAQNMLFRELLSTEVITMTLMENSLLVYTADNVLSHYLIIPTAKTIQLQLCGSIGFEGVIAFPKTVRSLSWMIPDSQKTFGDPADDLSVARILMTIGGRMVYFKPRRIIAEGQSEVSYDMQILSNLIEFYWIHSSGIGALENSLWGYDGYSVCVWLDVLTIESNSSGSPKECEGTISTAHMNLAFALDFYPLSALMNKGVILGVDSENVTRPSTTYVHYRLVTTTHLFLQHVLRYHLQQQDIQSAVRLATSYQTLVYFGHALEVLLHSIIEADEDFNTTEAGEGDAVLQAAVDCLDHFDEALDIVVGCARKTEMARWKRLFDAVGKPKYLFQTCLRSGRLRTAASYLLVLHNLEQSPEGNSDAINLLQQAIKTGDWQLCRELLRFLQSIDSSGKALQEAIVATGLNETSSTLG